MGRYRAPEVDRDMHQKSLRRKIFDNNPDFRYLTNSKIEFKFETIEGNAGMFNVLSKTGIMFSS